MAMRLPASLLAIALLAGCTVVAPQGTAVITNHTTVLAGSPVPTEPWPTHTARSPFPDEPTATGSRIFRGEGVNEWIGPVVLARGRQPFRVQFDGRLAPGGDFRLTLRNKQGQFVATLLTNSGSFAATNQMTLEIGGEYFMAVEEAEGSWEIELTAP